VIDTADGSQVGATFTRAGAGSTVLSADGSRAIFTTSSSGLGNPVDSPTVAVIDTATGNQVGSNLATPIGGVQSVVFTGDGSRAVVTIRRYDPGSSSFSSAVLVIDTATGNQVGATLTIAGAASTMLNAGGSRAVVATADTLRVAVIDTATGRQVGSTVNLPGVPLASLSDDMVLSADGSRFLIASYPADQAFILGALQVVATVLLLPLLIFFPVLGPALQFAQSFQAENWTVIDTASGAAVGSTTISGLDSVQFWNAPSPIVSADGTHALVVGFTRWDWSNLFRLSTRVSTLQIG
jgi:hypothetical protein